jgi:hypothetical protein
VAAVSSSVGRIGSRSIFASVEIADPARGAARVRILAGSDIPQPGWEPSVPIADGPSDLGPGPSRWPTTLSAASTWECGAAPSSSGR